MVTLFEGFLLGGVRVAFQTACGETWFYGGEIQVGVDDPSVGPLTEIAAVSVESGAKFFAFGTAIRAGTGILTGDLSGTRIHGVKRAALDPAFSAFLGVGDPVFHMHGGIINASAPGAGTADVHGLGTYPCTNASHVSFRGSGQDVTRVVGDFILTSSSGNVTFQGFTLVGKVWSAGGPSTWLGMRSSRWWARRCVRGPGP